jgi:hypothetical protein
MIGDDAAGEIIVLDQWLARFPATESGGPLTVLILFAVSMFVIFGVAFAVWCAVHRPPLDGFRNPLTGTAVAPNGNVTGRER